MRVCYLKAEYARSTAYARDNGTKLDDYLTIINNNKKDFGVSDKLVQKLIDMAISIYEAEGDNYRTPDQEFEYTWDHCIHPNTTI